MHLARLTALPRDANPWQWDLPSGNTVTEGNFTALDLVANAFLPQMVRTIVGTLLEVGQGKRTVDTIEKLLRGRDRRAAGPTAKPHGLCLVWVEY
jgi:tRNA pseudouridine38-40 synthase